MPEMPIFQTFLAEAEEAARRGESETALELLGLALDLAPANQIPSVLLSAERVRARAPLGAGTPIPAPPRIAYPTPRFPTHAPPLAPLRLPTPAPYFPDPHGHPGHAARTPAAEPRGIRRSRSRAPRAALAIPCLAIGLSLSAWSAGIIPAPRLPFPDRTDIQSRAEAALRRGGPSDASEAAAGSALRARALAAGGDLRGAEQAWLEAAERDVRDGETALEAGDALAAMGRLESAADAYLYAAAYPRTASERERIAVAQARVGRAGTAERVREISRRGMSRRSASRGRGRKP